jgi:hypothetical protein
MNELAHRFFGMPLLAVVVGIGVLASDRGDRERDLDRPRAAVLDDPEHQANCVTCEEQRRFRDPVGDAGEVTRGRFSPVANSILRDGSGVPTVDSGSLLAPGCSRPASR